MCHVLFCNTTAYKYQKKSYNSKLSYSFDLKPKYIQSIAKTNELALPFN